MVAQERANRILAAWVAGNADWLKSEIEGVLSTRQESVARSTEEKEEQELLESVASDLWTSLARTHVPGNERLHSTFALLRHLSHRSGGTFLRNGCTA